MPQSSPPSLSAFFNGKPELPKQLFDCFAERFEAVGNIRIEATKSMIGISNDHRRIAWVTQVGKAFIHVVFPFKKAYPDNLCFIKIAQVPGQEQYNHHLRLLSCGDVNTEVLKFMKLAFANEGR